MSPEARRLIPRIDRLVRDLAGDATGLPRPLVVDRVRAVVDAHRKRARRTRRVPGADEILAACRDELRRARARLLGPVINATGVVLHTNLGRAPLSAQAVEAVAAVARGYSNLELDLEHGRRGDRYVHVEPLIAVAAGAEAALVVNNNAAAVLLVCTALASGRDVVISRGELIEIGGEFRIPEILASSGARLREVGTTNRTHLRDYERAIGDDTAFVLKVHPSNYRVVGFTTAPEVSELAGLTRTKGVPLVYDVGSGLLDRMFSDEPVVTDAVAAGADLVCFSGDKLLGGPQAGIVAGRADLVAPLRSHPLLRALRPDKMQLAALQATVAAYLDGKAGDIPVWTMADAPAEAIARRAKALARKLEHTGLETEIVAGESVTGGGSLPGEGIPTSLLRLRRTGRSPGELAEALRKGAPPVVVRVEDGRVVIDLRTVAPSDDRLLAGLVARAAGS